MNLFHRNGAYLVVLGVTLVTGCGDDGGGGGTDGGTETDSGTGTETSATTTDSTSATTTDSTSATTTDSTSDATGATGDTGTSTSTGDTGTTSSGGACEGYDNMADCDGDAACSWVGNPNQGVCVEEGGGGPACGQLPTAMLCEMVNGCTWNGEDEVCEG